MSGKDEELQVERQTIRQVMAALREEQEQEKFAQAQQKVAKKREQRAEQLRRARKERENRARERHAARTKALKDSNSKVAAHVADASRALRAALRDATETPMQRRSAEGREQQRIVRSIQTAMGALRRIGGGSFYETDVDFDLDLDAG